MSKKVALNRVNTYITDDHNDWLNSESERTGISKSQLIQNAIDNYMSQRQAMSILIELSAKIDKLENIVQED